MVVKLRHLRHPLQAARALGTLTLQFLAEARFRRIPRVRRSTCWCGGELRAFAWHASYGICVACGTYVNRRPPATAALERLYGLDLYWRTRQRLKRLPTIEEGAARYQADGRVERWLELVERYAGGRRVVEVGCAPGALLRRLADRGYRCVGVEISADVAAWVRQRTGLDVRAGFFPGIELPECDVFLAFDVLEHSPCPREFMVAAAGLLTAGGVAIVQTVVDRYDYEPPLAPRFDLFDDVEHTFLFTDRALERLAAWAGLEVVTLDVSLWVGGEVAVFRKPERSS